MIGLDLRLRRNAPDVGQALHIAGFVHLADLRELVGREIDFERRAQPCLLEQHVIAGVGRELGTVLAVELHVADGPVDLPGRQAVRQPLKHGLVCARAIVHQRLQRPQCLVPPRICREALAHAAAACRFLCPTEMSSSRSLPVRHRKPWPSSAASIRSCSAGSLKGLTPPSTNSPSTTEPSRA